MAQFESGLEVHEPPETNLPEHHVPEPQANMHAGYGNVGQSDDIPLSQKDEGDTRDTWRHEDHWGNRDATRPQRILGMTPLLFGLVVAVVTAALSEGRWAEV